MNKQIKCINDRIVINSKKIHITKGTVYIVISETSDLYEILDDMGNRASYAKFRFEELK